MQAYDEGFAIMQEAASKGVPEERRYNLDLADVWLRGSVINSWLVDFIALSLAEDPALSKYFCAVDDLDEGRLAVNAAIEEALPADVFSVALFARFRSCDKEGTRGKPLSAMLYAFGGHLERQ